MYLNRANYLYNNIPAYPNETYYNNLLSNVGTIRAAYMKYQYHSINTFCTIKYFYK